MIRNLKALGLALVAVFAMSALSASAATAATDHFTAEQSPALLTGVSHDNRFEITDGPSFECTTSRFAATINNGATEATVDVTYNGTLSFIGDSQTQTKSNAAHCNSSLGNVTIDMNGCGYILTGSTTGDHNASQDVDATVWVYCPGTEKIKITSSLGPVISIPAQTPTSGGVTYQEIANHSGGNKTGVRVTATATGITWTCASAFLCGLGGIPTHGNDSDYTGTVDITGYEDFNGLPTPVTEGAKINIGIQTTA